MSDENTDGLKPVRLNHTVAVQALFDIRSEAANQADSGDIHVASSARRDYLLASVLLQLLGNVGVEAFNQADYPNLPTPDDLKDATTADNADAVVTPNVAASIPAATPDATQQAPNGTVATSDGQQAQVAPTSTPDVAPTPTPDTTANEPVPGLDNAPPNTPDNGASETAAVPSNG